MNIAPPPTPAISSDLLARFIALVGDRYAVTDPEEQEKYLVEGRNLYRGTSPLILRPGTVKEVAVAEATVRLGKLGKRVGLVCLERRDCLLEHRLGLGRSAFGLCPRERSAEQQECRRDGSKN